jgi:hypothetical protein
MSDFWKGSLDTSLDIKPRSSVSLGMTCSLVSIGMNGEREMEREMEMERERAYSKTLRLFFFRK